MPAGFEQHNYHLEPVTLAVVAMHLYKAVLDLRKLLHGSRQAARSWNRTRSFLFEETRQWEHMKMLCVKSESLADSPPREEALLLLDYICPRTHVRYWSVTEIPGDCLHHQLRFF